MSRWHRCYYESSKLNHDGWWEDGKWYEWLDIYDNREVARMKSDAIDHFYPPTNKIEEEDVIAFREIIHKEELQKDVCENIQGEM